MINAFSLSTWTVTVLLAAGVSTHAEEPRRVNHDGVSMIMSKAGAEGLEIAYGTDIPSELRELGVTAGTMLVKGQWEDKTFVGEAWAFSSECKSISYPVLGVVDHSGALVVFGPVPRSCKAGDSSWGKQALMRFEVPVPAAAPRAERKAKPRPEPKPKPRPAPRPQRQQPQYYPQQWPSYPQWWR